MTGVALKVTLQSLFDSYIVVTVVSLFCHNLNIISTAVTPYNFVYLDICSELHMGQLGII